MMSLKVQIFSLLFSLVFGFVFGVFTNLNYKYLFQNTVFCSFFADFFFCIDMALLYFFCIRAINNGILHYYFGIVLLIGFYFGYSASRFIRRL